MAKDNVFSNIAEGITAPIGGTIRGVARGLFPGAAKATDVKFDTLKRQKDMQQLQLMISMMKDPGSNQQTKKAASDTARRILFSYHPEFENIGAGPMTQRKDWWSGLTAPPTTGIAEAGAGAEEGFVNPMAVYGEPEETTTMPSTSAVTRRGLPSPFRVESIAGKPGEAEPTITLKPTGMSPADRQTYATGLRKEYNTLSKDYWVIEDSYARVLASAKDPSAAGDLALIFNYMKMLDPNSVVRESEFANAAATGSMGERWKAIGLKLLTGERLSQIVRRDFVDRAKRLFKAQQKVQGNRVKRYSGLAKRAKVSPKDVVTKMKPIEEPSEKIQMRNPEGEIWELDISEAEEAKKRGWEAVK